MLNPSRWIPGALAAAGLAGLLLASCSPADAPDSQTAGNDEAPQTPVAAAQRRRGRGTGGETEGPRLVVPEEFEKLWKPWKGDLDGIVERRRVRMLVTFNATNYFVDLGEQGGATYEFGRLLEKELNRRFQKGNLQIDVIFIPVARDRLLPALAEGYGDIAAANLTITDERLQTVDFTDPVARPVDQIVVTGPGAPALGRLEDLVGSASPRPSVQRLLREPSEAQRLLREPGPRPGRHPAGGRGPRDRGHPRADQRRGLPHHGGRQLHGGPLGPGAEGHRAAPRPGRGDGHAHRLGHPAEQPPAQELPERVREEEQAGDAHRATC